MQRFPADAFHLPAAAVIKDAIGKARSYLSQSCTTGKDVREAKRASLGCPEPRDHPTLYQGTCLCLEEGEGEAVLGFVRLKVYDGHEWQLGQLSGQVQPLLPAATPRSGLGSSKVPPWSCAKQSAELHFPQTKEIAAKKVKESKLDPDLVTVAVDLNVKNLAVITVRQHGQLSSRPSFSPITGSISSAIGICRRIAKKQWHSGKPVKGEHSNQQLWRHVQQHE